MNDSPKDPIDDSLVGTRFDQYQVGEVIGRGGYSVVYRARQISLDREVALKVLTTRASGIVEEQVEAFVNEARIAAKLDHPCLLNIYDVIEADGRHGMAMELVEGGDLARRVKLGGPIPWQQAIPIIRDVADALQFAHSHGYAHRDVKPANVLLTVKGGARLADLGLADGKSFAGTPAFMAPEQIARLKTGKRTDLYALGCTAFAMLTGRAPFAGVGTKQMLQDHVHKLPPLINDFDVGAPQELEDLIDHMLEKKASERPESAAEVIESLAAIGRADAVGPSARPTVPRSRARRGKRSRKSSRGSAGAMIFTLVLILVILAGVIYGVEYFRR